MCTQMVLYKNKNYNLVGSCIIVGSSVSFNVHRLFQLPDLIRGIALHSNQKLTQKLKTAPSS